MKPSLALCLLTTLFFISTSAICRADDLTITPVDLTSAPPCAATVSASSPVTRFFTEGEWYFSWGYNKETWAPSDIHVSQPSLGNDFTIHNVKGHDEPGWDTGIFNKGLFAPQTNIRIGRFVDDDRTIAVELSLDHTKYTSTIGQTATVTGTINNAPVNTTMQLDENTFRYNLHNGANHLMLNVVKRLPLIGETNESMSLATIGKVGIGLMVPHSDNTVLGNKNNVGEKKFSNYFGTSNGWWQFDGWTAGIEAGVRFVLVKPVYLELTDKVAYARLYDIPVYKGTANQSLWMNEVILSLGFTYDGVKKRANN
jgi:hypothetical protein